LEKIQNGWVTGGEANRHKHAKKLEIDQQHNGRRGDKIDHFLVEGVKHSGVFGNKGNLRKDKKVKMGA